MVTAIYGGTFNPPHLGHEHCLEAVCSEIAPDRIFVLPDRIPPHKSANKLVSGEDRLKMCSLAFEDYKNVTVSDWELKRSGKSYSVITLRHFKEEYPDDELYFIMGSDMLLSFESWYCFEEILQLSGLICVSRSDDDSYLKLQAHAKHLTNSCGGRIIIVKADPLEVSSTQIRKMIANSQDCYCYLNKNVVQYIKDNSLYTT